MRRIFGIWLLLLPMVLMAAPVTQEQAMQRARVFVNSRPRMAQGGKLKAARAPLKLQSAQATASYYVFNVGEGQGFVIASGDDRTPAILGYADDGNFDVDNIPTNMRAWLEDYERQISALDKYPAAQVNSTIHEAVAPLLTSTWNQLAPYNEMCPMVDGNKAKTGCVATAMAQVLNYYKYPAQTTMAIPAYTTRISEIDMPEIPVTDIDWDNILDRYDGSETTAQKNAVATLMKLCGQALEMEYCAEVSGTPSINCVKALCQYFDYDKTIQYLSREHFSATDWENLIYNELANSRPVLYAGHSTGGGHEIIVDGYDGDGMFHINWGWGGDDNGYFLLSVLNPYNNKSPGASRSDDGYSFSQDAIVGIQHSTGGKTGERLSVYGFTNKGADSYTRTSDADDFTGIKIRILCYNLTGDRHDYSLRFALVDGSSNQTSVDIDEGNHFGFIENLFGFETIISDISFGASLADGDYYIILESRSEDSEDWEPCWGSDVYRIKATISGNTLTLTGPEVNLSGKIAPIDNAKFFSRVNVQAQITNNGTYFNNYVYLSVDNVITGGRMFEAKAGETVTFDIDYLPRTAGTMKLNLCYKNENDQFVPFAVGSITIPEDTGEPQLTGTITLTNANRQGNVEENTVNVSAEFQNIGDGTLVDGWVFVALYKHNLETEKWKMTAPRDYKLVTIAPGNSNTFTTSFKDLELGGNYFIVMGYYKDDDNIIEYDETIKYFDVIDPSAPAPVMTGSLALTNANANGDIEGTTVNFKGYIKNKGTAALENGGLWIDLYQIDESGQSISIDYMGDFVTLGVGEHVSFNTYFDNLEVGGKYALALSYNLYGSGNYIVIDNCTVVFNVVEEGSGIETLPTTTLPFTSTYDLQGRRVSANHRGLVISRELKPDGTVVVRKVIN
ncbi:MAG: C10 family peptidase [Bacteroidaceae bacterium]|nr:C10 family peptidase [Bacteroidaceae bacterium]